MILHSDAKSAEVMVMSITDLFVLGGKERKITIIHNAGSIYIYHA